MNGRNLGRGVLSAHVVIGVLVIVCATVLGALHDLDAEAVVTIYGTAIGLVGGSAAAIGAVSGAINGKAVVSQATLDNALTQLGDSTPAPAKAD